MKLFISQPMNGKTDSEILREREVAIESAKRNFKAEDVEVIDSYIKENAPENSNQGLWYLGKSIELLSGADVAYFAKDWEEYRGCRIENTCATEYDITVIEDYRK